MVLDGSEDVSGVVLDGSEDVSGVVLDGTGYEDETAEEVASKVDDGAPEDDCDNHGNTFGSCEELDAGAPLDGPFWLILPA